MLQKGIRCGSTLNADGQRPYLTSRWGLTRGMPGCVLSEPGPRGGWGAALGAPPQELVMEALPSSSLHREWSRDSRRLEVEVQGPESRSPNATSQNIH